MSSNQPRKCEKFKSLLGHVTFNYNLFVVFKYFLNVSESSFQYSFSLDQRQGASYP